MTSRLIAPRSIAAVAATAGRTLIPGLDEATAAAIDARRASMPAPASPRRPASAARRRGRLARLFALVVLVTPLLVGSINTYSSPPPTRGDELSDAIAAQKKLAAKIKAQKAQVAKLAALQVGLSNDIGQTQTALAGVNQDLTAVQKKVTKLSADIKVVQATYADLVVQLADLNAAAHLGHARGAGQGRPAPGTQGGPRRAAPGGLRGRRAVAARGDPVGRLVHDRAERCQQPARARRPRQGARRSDRRRHGDAGDDPPDRRGHLRGDRGAAGRRRPPRRRPSGSSSPTSGRRRRSSRCSRPRRSASSRSSAPPYAALAANKVRAAQILAQEAKTAKSLKSKIDRLVREQFAGGNIPSQYNGTLRWPINGTVTQEFGCTGFWAEPPLGNCAHFHTGIDIADPMYTPIRAAGDGRVVYEGPLSDGAWVVIIAHSKDLVTLYGHVDNRHHPPVVRAGQFVRQGPDHRLRRRHRELDRAASPLGASSSTTRG